MVQHLRDCGRHRNERILQAEEQILERVDEDPDINTRRLAAEVGVSQSVVHSTLKEQRLHPYNVQKVQALGPADFLSHIIYCEWLLKQCRERLNFLNSIMLTDEDSLFSTATTLIFGPICQEVRFQRRFSINAWVVTVNHK